MINRFRSLMNPKKVTELLLTSRIVQKWPTAQIKRQFADTFTHIPQPSRQQKVVGYWLLGCAGMVYGAVAIGGATRLTESGLSMVNWDLLRTMKPPLNDAEWEREFEQYKSYPEYKFKTLNDEMALQQFKFIWTMEYVHRMWGRAIGVAFLLPCAYFWAKGRFNGAMKVRMALAGSLIGTQGLVGWWMVKSGLDPSKNSNADLPRVSQYRLATHLSLAYILYTVLFWNGLSHVFTPYNHNKIQGIGRLRGMSHLVKASIFSTILMGAFVAGLDAGLVHNTWPGFGDRWIPENMFTRKPLWRNFFENDTTVQFMHRHLAYFTLASITVTWFFNRRLNLNRRAKIALHTLLALGYAQAVLGITTLIMLVPTWLGSLHQNGSLALLTAALWLSNEIRRLPK
ncbi:Cox-15 [Aphelenchoides besseyi]|nr:Cox-15 [Aphelenchoides besseyi]